MIVKNSSHRSCACRHTVEPHKTLCVFFLFFFFDSYHCCCTIHNNRYQYVGYNDCDLPMNIVKFDGSGNFKLWQKRVKDVLVQQGLVKALSGKQLEGMNATD